MGRPTLNRAVAAYIIDHCGLKLARACRLIKQVRSTQFLLRRKESKLALRQRLRELAQVRVRWGYRRLHVLLKRESFQLGVNQTYRWYCLEQLQLRAWRKKRRKSAVARQARMQPRRANDAWSMDFVADQLADGTKAADDNRHLQPEIPSHRLRGENVVVALNRIIEKRAPSRCLFVDNGSEFSGQMLDPWAYHHKAKIDFSRPSKPTENFYIERSTDRCVMNASTSTGSPPWPRCRPSWRLGAWTTTRFGLGLRNGTIECRVKLLMWSSIVRVSYLINHVKR